MSDSLYPYYERELLALRATSQEFARRYPATAGRLLLEPGRSGDPHVERLIESFALLTARTQARLDDDFPELTEGVLNVLYPHYLRPLPSMAVVQFDAEPLRTPPGGHVVPAGGRLRSRRVGGHACEFRTAYPVTLWPVVLTSARLAPPPFPPGGRPPAGTAAALFLRFEYRSQLPVEELALDRLRLYLAGDRQRTAGLYQLLFHHATAVEVRALDAPDAPAVRLDPAECIHPVGFEPHEGLLPYPRQAAAGYRLLTEFFAFPEKFEFFDLSGLAAARRGGFGRAWEVAIYLNRSRASLESAVDAETFRLGCTPAVNLFARTAEPIPLEPDRHEYRVVPDVSAADATEVYSVDSVVSTDPLAEEAREFQPFFARRHARGEGASSFWYASRRPSGRDRDPGTDVFLHLVDMDFRPASPSVPTLVVWTTCTNRWLPALLRDFGEHVGFELEEPAPVARVLCPRAPTAPAAPPLRRGAYWRLLSHLNLNHLSISDGEEGADALREMLELYDPSGGGEGRSAARNLIDGVRSVSCRRAVARLPSGPGGAPDFARGVGVTVELEEAKYVGTGAYLFASVLDRLLGLYASVNSFARLTAHGVGGEGFTKTWPPRAGVKTVI